MKASPPLTLRFLPAFLAKFEQILMLPSLQRHGLSMVTCFVMGPLNFEIIIIIIIVVVKAKLIGHLKVLTLGEH